VKNESNYHVKKMISKQVDSYVKNGRKVPAVNLFSGPALELLNGLISVETSESTGTMDLTPAPILESNLDTGCVNSVQNPIDEVVSIGGSVVGSVSVGSKTANPSTTSKSTRKPSRKSVNNGLGVQLDVLVTAHVTQATPPSETPSGEQVLVAAVAGLASDTSANDQATDVFSLQSQVTGASTSVVDGVPGKRKLRGADSAKKAKEAKMTEEDEWSPGEIYGSCGSDSEVDSKSEIDEPWSQCQPRSNAVSDTGVGYPRTSASCGECGSKLDLTPKVKHFTEREDGALFCWRCSAWL
jgi:hypothetical protein